MSWSGQPFFHYLPNLICGFPPDWARSAAQNARGFRRRGRCAGAPSAIPLRLGILRMYKSCDPLWIATKCRWTFSAIPFGLRCFVMRGERGSYAGCSCRVRTCTCGAYGGASFARTGGAESQWVCGCCAKNLRTSLSRVRMGACVHGAGRGFCNLRNGWRVYR